MDIARPDLARAKRKKRLLFGAIGVSVLAAVTVAVSQLKPAAPTVDRNLVFVDTVKRGTMLRQVRGLGTLVPEEIRIVTARTAGRVDRIVLRPGAPVNPDSVIVELINPDVLQAADAAESQQRAAEAELTNLRIRLESELLSREALVARARSDHETSRLQAEVNQELFKDGLVSSLELRRTQVAADEAGTRHEIEKKCYAFLKESMQLQLTVKQGDVDRQRAQTLLRLEERDALKVRAGLKGVLQTLPLEIGQQVATGAALARVADPTRLKAEIRIPETQAKDIQPGQVAQIDTHNGLIEGSVIRVDPSVQNGSVTVDIALSGELPRGSRPDLSVDGVVELERLTDVLYVGRPASGQERGLVSLFRIGADGSTAERIGVKLGRSSVSTIEITGGLQLGDRVILSDMSQWDTSDRIKLN